MTSLAIAAFLGSLASYAAAQATTVAASWDYQSATNNFDQGGFNSGALNNGDFSNYYGSFERIKSGSAISVSATVGQIRLLNEFSISEGRYGRFSSSSLIDATVAGGFQDSLTITDTNRTGQRGVYTGSIKVNLVYTASGNVGNRNVFGVGVGSNMANASAASNKVFYDNGGISTYAYKGFPDGAVGPQSFTNEILSFSVPFTFGEAFGMAVWMKSYIGTPGRTTLASAISHDASHTVEWAGTVLVEDAVGTDLVPGSYTLTSTSGQNYVTAIPEPSSVLLGAFGLVLGALRLRRSRK